MPAATPVTIPVLLTVATAPSLDDHVIGRPARTFPFASDSVAVSVVVDPSAMVDVAGVTTTDATGTSVTVMLAVPTCPSLVAEMVTGPPAATAVTNPASLTVAMVGSLVVQVTTRFVSTLPLESFVVALSCCVVPTMIDALDGDTVTLATGAGGPRSCGLKAAAVIPHPEPAKPVAAYEPAGPTI